MPFLFDKNFLTNTIILMIVSIFELENSEYKSLEIRFEEVIKDINPHKPVTADLCVSAISNEYINVTGEANAVINSICDNCLKEFSKEINIKIDETFIKTSLFEDYKEETELSGNSFVEDLNGKDEIDITDLIYQSVILNIPNKLVCDINCIGEEKIQEYIKTEISDPRLDVFKSIKTE